MNDPAALRPGSAVETDALIIGAGPAGLFQAFQLGLLEIESHIVDALPHAGGQCMELYPDKPIYDIPGVVHYTGRELVANLMRQVEPFKPSLHLGQLVTSLEQQDDGHFLVSTSRGTRFRSRCVFIAGGVGAFQPRLLNVEGINHYRDQQLFYTLQPASEWANKHLLVVGGEDAALRAAIELTEEIGANGPASVSLLHRRDVFQASDELVAQVKALIEAQKLQFIVGQISGYEDDAGRLAAVQVTDVKGETGPVALDALLVFLGLSPKLGPIADWGLALERKQLPVDTEKFSTATPGIFAVGDVNTYPGKKKLIVSAFHECALAAYAAAAIVFPEKKIMLQYTTTSTRLHALLGVNSQRPA